MLHKAEQFDVSLCHGCGLCAMVCPVYQQDGQVMQTPHGWAKALQYNGEIERDDVLACILCGACAPLCPQDIDMMQMLIGIRESFNEAEPVPEIATDKTGQKGKVVFIADSHCCENEEYRDKVMNLLRQQHAVMAIDQGQDISEAMHAGKKVSHARLHQFLTTLQGVKKIIISDGLLQMLIRDKLPQINMVSLGRLMSSNTAFRKRLRTNDFYVIDSQSYHADFDRAVIYYDELQQQTGCQLNRDLHRLGIPSGVLSLENGPLAGQVEWLLAGREMERIIVESLADYLLLSDCCDQPVVHISELL